MAAGLNSFLQSAFNSFATRSFPPSKQNSEKAAEPSPILAARRSEEHTSELQSLMRISYAVFCLKKKKQTHTHHNVKLHKQSRHTNQNRMQLTINNTQNTFI